MLCTVHMGGKFEPRQNTCTKLTDFCYRWLTPQSVWHHVLLGTTDVYSFGLVVLKSAQILSPSVGFATMPFVSAMHCRKATMCSLHCDSSPFFHWMQCWTALLRDAQARFGRTRVPSWRTAVPCALRHFSLHASRDLAKCVHLRPLDRCSRKQSLYRFVSRWQGGRDEAIDISPLSCDTALQTCSSSK